MNAGMATVNYIKVGMSTCGLAAGAQEVFNTLTQEVARRNLNIPVLKCGCVGMCYAEPLVEVAVEGLPTVIYGKVNRDIAVKILDKHVMGKMIVQDYVYEGVPRT